MATRSKNFRYLMGAFTGGVCGVLGGLVIPDQVLPLLVDAQILDPKVAATVDFYWVLGGCPVAAAIGVFLGIRIAHRRLAWEADQQIADPEQRDSVDTGRHRSAAIRGWAVLGLVLGLGLLCAVVVLGPRLGVPENIVRTVERYWYVILLIADLATTILAYAKRELARRRGKRTVSK